MKRRNFFISAIAVLILTAFLSGKKNTALLLRKNKDKGIFDTIQRFSYEYSPHEKKDLLFSIRKFNYPPKLPKDLALRTSSSVFGKMDQKSIYDEKGRLIKYYYKGSMVSAMMPYGYDILYKNDTSFTITHLKDDNNRFIYELIYDNSGNLGRIETSDNSGIFEKLIISY
jgi:hypothetical protein